MFFQKHNNIDNIFFLNNKNFQIHKIRSNIVNYEIHKDQKTIIVIVDIRQSSNERTENTEKIKYKI